jgi:hypothetical protein
MVFSSVRLNIPVIILDSFEPEDGTISAYVVNGPQSVKEYLVMVTTVSLSLCLMLGLWLKQEGFHRNLAKAQ